MQKRKQGTEHVKWVFKPYFHLTSTWELLKEITVPGTTCGKMETQGCLCLNSTGNLVCSQGENH